MRFRSACRSFAIARFLPARMSLSLANENGKDGSGAAPQRLDARIFLLALGAFAIGTDSWVMAGILRGVAQDLSVSVEATGQVVTAYSLTYALSAPLLAAITAHWPWRRTIIIALIGIAGADAVCASAGSFWIVIAGRIVAGASAGLYTPTAFAAATGLWPPTHRGAALAKVALGTTAAIVCGVPLATWIGHAFGWRITFVLGSLLAASAALSLAASRLPMPDVVPRPGLAERLAPVTRRRVVLSLLAAVLWTSAAFTVYTYAAVIFGMRLGLDNIAVLLLGYGLGGLTGSQSGGPLVDRFGTTRPILLAFSVAALNYALMHFTGSNLLGAAAALFIMGFCAWAAWPAQQSRLVSFEPEHRPVVMSLFASAIQIGLASGSALGGLLLANFSPAAPTYAASVITVAGLGVFLLSNCDRLWRDIGANRTLPQETTRRWQS
jgi:MFS transporter, DHA1 family, inner membrane transport protein